ncbi:hypothetical protein B0919_01620 [Hymenobacter sp. CRA2]|nr:hypothetical protein B0919_01620 [Hymenobacter sp. CRA2]
MLGAALPQARAQAPVAADQAHCLLLPLDPVVRARAAALVVEGEVLSQQGFWDAAHRRIYTASTVQVYKLLKGQWRAGQQLTVITEGGTVGEERQTLTNTLTLAPGAQGLFFLMPSAFQDLGQVGWTPYASEQGFVRYDLSVGTAAEPFRQYPRLDNTFYQAQAGLTGQALQELAPNSRLLSAVARQQGTAARGNAPLISSLAPTQVTAGTNTVLTISGSGFGAAPGSVAFRNADDGGSTFTTALGSDIVSWSDTRVQVRVPSYTADGHPAGTGNVRVTTADQLIATSLQSIAVLFAVTNVQETNSGQVYQPVHINQDGRGGYTFRPDPGIAQNAAALAAFGRALNSWRCQTFMNWRLGSTRTARGIASDDVNALEFDQAGELPVNVLGRTTSYYVGCRAADGTVRFWAKEIDMQFDDGVNWQFGPGLPSATQFDFETVVLHELGHAQQLSHVIAPGLAVMHYAIGRAQVNRTLDSGRDIQGGHLVLERSVQPGTCGPAPLQPAPLDAAAVARGGSGNVVISWNTISECNLAGFGVERSTDQVTWTTLGQLPSQNSTGSGYSYQDPQPPVGLVYYRLRVRHSLSTAAQNRDLVTAPIAARAQAGAVFSLFPNPVRDNLVQVEFDAPTQGNMVVRVFDAIGRYYGGQQITVPQAGINTLSIPLPTLRAGWYLLRWTAGTQQGSVPFLVVE